MPILAAFSRSPDAMTLTDLAKAAEITTSKAHKYLASFIRAGLVTQDSRNGRYRLGPLALELGFTALRHLNAANISESALLELRDSLDLTASMTVWANQGPTIVRRVEPHQMQFVMMRLGTVLPLLTSVSGRVFLAYLGREYTQPFIDAELGDVGGPAAKFGLRTMQDVEKLIARIRATRLAETEGIIAGLVGLSTAIFDSSNTITAAITVVGARDTNLSLAKPKLLAIADDLSRQLGATVVADAMGSR